MDVSDREEFFYHRFYAAFGSVALIMGVGISWAVGGMFLGFWTIEFEGGELEKVIAPYFGLLIGPYAIFAGIVFLRIGLDRRPAVVIDGDGVFYRPHGTIIPWTDVAEVNIDAERLDSEIVVRRFSGPDVEIEKRLLKGDDLVYPAILQQWQRRGHRSP